MMKTQVFVTPNGAGNGSGSSWQNASTLQNTLQNAQSTQQLWMRKGIYYLTSTLIISSNISGLKMYGGFAGNETALSQRDFVLNQTILDGQDAVQILEMNGDNAEANGIIFRKGYITGTATGGTNPNTGGGAIRIRGNNAILKNCRFLNNTSSSERGGGAVFMWYGSGHLIENCEFQANKTTHTDSNGGGAIHIWDDNVTIRNTEFINNSSEVSGGAIYTWYEENLMIENCLFQNNSSKTLGGAIHNRSLLQIANSQFITNRSLQEGGAIYTDGNAKISNSLFNGNISQRSGGAIHNEAELYVTNSTLVSNTNTAVTHSYYASDSLKLHRTYFYNSIFNGNTAASGLNADLDRAVADANDSSEKDFRKNIFQQNSTPNNIITDPQFVNFANGNFRIKNGSPGHNFGNTALYNTVSEVNAGASLDLDEQPRLFSTSIDAGCYELQENLSTSEENSLKFSIYPNPVTDVLHISTTGLQPSYVITNTAGQQVMKGRISGNTINVSELSKGIYIITFYLEGRNVSEKFIKN